MKIAYYLEWDVSTDSGVYTKVKAQINQWRLSGHTVELIAVTPNVPDDGSNINIFSIKLPRYFKGSVRTYLNKIFTLRKIDGYLSRFHPDIVYIRQSTWHPGLGKLLKKYNSIMECNTDDLNEIKLEKFFKKTIYLFGRDILISSVNGFLSVSNEIAKLYEKYNKPIAVISNGYDLTVVQKFDKTINKRKQIIFVGSKGQKWHGSEKIAYMAKNLPEFDFHIVGPKINNQNIDNLIVHGFMNKNDLFNLYQKMDVGIGTLSLYEKHMQEASPLKVREYIAFRLPVIVGYIDTDLENQEYILNLGNYKDNVCNNITQIKEFVEKSDELRVKIDPNIISCEYKEKNRLEFLLKEANK